MKKLNYYTLSVFFLLCAVFTGCNEEKTIYDGNEYVLFADTTYYMPVVPQAEKTFEVVISTTRKADYDRPYAVEIVIDKSNAVEGYHFDLLSNNATVKAGELTTTIQVKGHYDHLVYGKDLYFTLRLLSPEDQQWAMYGTEAKVELYKCSPMAIENFTGNLKMFASFPFSDSNVSFYVKSTKLNDSTLLIQQPFNDKYDLKVRFHSNKVNPFEDALSVSEQTLFIDNSVGRVFGNTVETNPSFYITEARSMFLYLDMFVPTVGTFGVKQYIFKWVPQSEVDASNNSTGTPFNLLNNKL